jgi:hypothetical protein
LFLGLCCLSYPLTLAAGIWLGRNRFKVLVTREGGRPRARGTDADPRFTGGR